MQNEEIAKALAALQGISSYDSDLATRHISPSNYTEHNPYIADGIDGLKEHIERLALVDHSRRVVRAFQDGKYVFTHSEGNILGQSVFFDVFRFDREQIVEHWGFSAPAAERNKSGHTQTDGPTKARLDHDTETSKSRVRAYYEHVHISGDHSDILQYFDGDRCIRHEPGVGDGVQAFVSDLAVLTQSRKIEEVRILLGEGDFVFVGAKGSHEGRPSAYIDIYRLENDKLAEHWGITPDFPSRSEWKNENGYL
jgi:predicted SnoaL-like aldol condensation-catalyzing enzyme